MLQVTYLMHLGHPLPAHFNQRASFTLIETQLLSRLEDLNAHPIQTLDRVLLVNTVVIPRLLYRCECYPLLSAQLQTLPQALERFVFAVSGLPSLVATKTLYTHRTRGLGLHSFSVL